MTTVTQINTSYAEQSAALQGQLGNLKDTRKSTAVQGEASAGVPFGVMVQKTAFGAAGSADVAKLMSATNNALAGVVIHSHAYDPVEDFTNATDELLKPKTLLSVLEEGEIWVKVEAGEVPAVAGAVRVRAVAAGAEVAGAFRVAADGTDCILLPHSRWRSAINADGLALLFLDLRGPVADT